MSRLFIPLRRRDLEALFKLAENELRDPRNQAALIIRAELIHRGMLSQEQPIEPDPCAKALTEVHHEQP
jgi:hypothetical protein